MLKRNVFVVTLRALDRDGKFIGDVVELVVCSINKEAARKWVRDEKPGFFILAITGLVELEARTKKILDVLAGRDASWTIMVDPVLQQVKQAA